MTIDQVLSGDRSIATPAIASRSRVPSTNQTTDIAAVVQDVDRGTVTSFLDILTRYNFPVFPQVDWHGKFALVFDPTDKSRTVRYVTPERMSIDKRIKSVLNLDANWGEIIGMIKDSTAKEYRFKVGDTIDLGTEGMSLVLRRDNLYYYLECLCPATGLRHMHHPQTRQFVEEHGTYVRPEKMQRLFSLYVQANYEFVGGAVVPRIMK